VTVAARSAARHRTVHTRRCDDGVHQGGNDDPGPVRPGIDHLARRRPRHGRRRSCPDRAGSRWRCGIRGARRRWPRRSARRRLRGPAWRSCPTRVPASQPPRSARVRSSRGATAASATVDDATAGSRRSACGSGSDQPGT
jgi:hypothetical protein